MARARATTGAPSLASRTPCRAAEDHRIAAFEGAGEGRAMAGAVVLSVDKTMAEMTTFAYKIIS